MAGGQVSGRLLAGALATLFAAAALFSGAGGANAQLPIKFPPGTIVLPNIVLPDVKLPTITLPKDGPPVVNLPLVSVPGVAVIDIRSLPPEIVFPAGDPLLLINLDGVSIVLPGLADLTAFGGGILGLVLDQVAPVSQLFASTAAGLLTSVDLLVDGLVSGGPFPGGGPMSGATSSDAPSIAGTAGSIVPLAASNVWTWNAVTFAKAEHSGFAFTTSGPGGATAGSTPPVRTTERADLPGILWDASGEFGYGRGTVFFGATGGVAQSDVELASTAAVGKFVGRKSGSVDLTTWSLGGFALFVSEYWYAGATAGGTWGDAETRNFITGARSDYDLSSFTGSVFAGTVLSLSDTLRVDLRGTVTYQNVVADAHEDSVGVTYGDHTTEAAGISGSARLFAVLHGPDGAILRPYVQAGISDRFHYDNALDISGVGFSFLDAGTGVFVAGGLDIELGGSLHLSGGVRHDRTTDYESLSGRLGVIVRLN